ncbi:MAG: HAMP domain-containing histidine kinase [Shimia sp.]|uniref:sensor histidine kinase n=1 Tax=Shimia sp. TaxID=1954381 RepID=UPI001B0727E3|nr:HAMP domain-containing sensor histidine kinase [Shimia sp.]MBO6895907.1 HAMP domain-containing histidine kinase [Shimia sp.]
MSQAFAHPTEVEIRAEEARMLRERAVASARSVFILILLISISLASVHLYREALIWAGLASVMVVVTILYARSWRHSEDTPQQVDRYLMGHVFISACTGVIWAIGAIQLASPTSELQTFLAGLFLTSITAGGVMAGTVYRPGYLAIAVCSLLPFCLYLLITMDGVQRIYGGFLLFFLSFCFTTNKTASQKTRDALAAKLTSRKAELALEDFAKAAKVQRATKRSLQAIRHDMAQPLLALRNFLAEMDRKATSPEQAVLVRQIRLALISQEALVEELSNVTQPTPERVHTEINVAELVAQLDAEYRPQFAAAGCALAVHLDLEVVESDRAKLERILRNFLSNAVKYGTSGGRVDLSVVAQNHESVWQVSDHGPGMTVAQLNAIRRGEELEVTSLGSGLGLGIARKLAQELGGSVEITSGKDSGTQALLRLPHIETANAQKQAFVLVVGQETLPNMGAWADLISSWVWMFAHAETCAEALGMITVLGQEPDLIVLHAPEGETFSSDEVRSVGTHAPVVHLIHPSQETSLPSDQTAIVLPNREAELRQMMESHLQNNANSRAL